jgi:hypothetical protein
LEMRVIVQDIRSRYGARRSSAMVAESYSAHSRLISFSFSAIARAASGRTRRRIANAKVFGAEPGTVTMRTSLTASALSGGVSPTATRLQVDAMSPNPTGVYPMTDCQAASAAARLSL